MATIETIERHVTCPHGVRIIQQIRTSEPENTLELEKMFAVPLADYCAEWGHR